MNTNKTFLALSITAFLVAGCGKSTPSNNTQSASAPNAAPQQTPPPGSNATGQQTAQQSQQPNAAPGSTGWAPMSAQTPDVPAPQPPQPFVVPSGTSLPIILSSKVDSRTDDAGQTFSGSLATPVTIEGEVAIPKGSEVTGVITKAKKQGTFKGEADLAITLTSLRVGGKSYPISTSTYARTVKGKGKRSAIVTGGGAAVGALIGGLAGGGKGAAIGLGVGGGGGLAASGATGGENVTLPAESRVTFKLVQAVTIDRQS